jgi:polar amino acid transport system substrate-binding protein
MDYFKKVSFTIICFFICCAYTNANEIKRVRILADDSYPPYSYVEKGELKGVYIDIIRASAKLMSDKYLIRIVAVPWKRALVEVKEGREFAILPPYKHIEERSYIWPYSRPIMTENIIAFCHNNINLQKYLKQPSKQIIPPLSIGINAGYLILNETLQQAKKNNNIVIQENKSTSANIMKLYTRRIGCYLNDKFSTQWELSKMMKKTKINFNNIQEALLVMSQTAHIGYTDNKSHQYHFKNDFVSRMDKALSEIISSDKYQEIINRYK